MTERLFEAAAEVKLTDRQQQAYLLVKGAGWDGLKSDEVGAAIHSSKHPITEPCDFCGTAGHELGTALRRKGLVERRGRRGGDGVLYYVWVVADANPPRVERDYELPEGF